MFRAASTTRGIVYAVTVRTDTAGLFAGGHRLRRAVRAHGGVTMIAGEGEPVPAELSHLPAVSIA
jgi:hypothetical protein